MKKKTCNLYSQVKDRIKKDIIGRGLIPGNKYFSLRRISAISGVSIITAMRAVEELVSEGILQTVERKGIFVSGKPMLAPLEITYLIRDETPGLYLASYHAGIMEGVRLYCSENSVPECVFRVGKYNASAKNLKQEIMKCLPRGENSMAVVGGKLHPTLPELLDSLAVPYVMTGQYSCVKGIKLIKPDNFSGMKKLMKYLMELGHRRIVFLQRIINDGINTTAESLDAIEEIKQDNPHLELEVFPVTDLTFDEGLRETLKRIDYIKKHKITAVAGSTDNVAAGILHALLDSGFKVPEEISVAGHDDYPLGAQVYPPLTTVRIDLKQMGRIAAAALIDFYMNRKKTGSVEFIPENLIVRKSTAKAFH